MAAAMGATAVLAVFAKPSRTVADVRARQPLEDLIPSDAQGWKLDLRGAGVIRPAGEQGRVYGIYDQVLERVYVHADGRQVMLSVAYGAEQSVGLQVHRPEICYPGGGFKVQGMHRATMPVAGQPLPVTRLVATMPGRAEPITYWSVLGDVAQEDAAAFRWRQIRFGLRGQILDGMLVRVSTIDADEARAFRVHTEFADALAGAMTAEQRARVIGRPGPAPA
jgi:EpsI family protein